MACGLSAHAAGFSWPESRADYWVLSMTWSPEYCRDHQASREPQCTEEHYFAAEALHPQYRGDPPGDCDADPQLPKDLLSRALHVVPNGEVFVRTWRREGRCAGLNVQDYILDLEYAKNKLVIPALLSRPAATVSTSSAELKKEFIAVNPGLDERGLVLNCSRQSLKGISVCFSRSFEFRECGADLQDSCGSAVHARRIRTEQVE